MLSLGLLSPELGLAAALPGEAAELPGEAAALPGEAAELPGEKDAEADPGETAVATAPGLGALEPTLGLRMGDIRFRCGSSSSIAMRSEGEGTLLTGK